MGATPNGRAARHASVAPSSRSAKSDTLRRYGAPIFAVGLLVLAAALAPPVGQAALDKSTVYALACIGGWLVARYPSLFIGFVMVIEEYSSGSAVADQLPWYDTFGSSIYNLSKNGIPVLVGIAVCAALGAVLRFSRGGPRTVDWLESVRASALPVIIVTAVAVHVAIYTLWARDVAAVSMLAGWIAVIAPWLLLAASYLVMLEIVTFPGAIHRATSMVGWLLIFKALVAIGTWLTTGGAVVDGQPGVVFYGALTPMLGIAALGAWAAGVGFGTWKGACVLLASVICVVGSFRLTMIIAAVVALIIVPVMTRNYSAWRHLAAALAATAALVALLPASSAGALAVTRLASLGALTGYASAADTSAALHVDDVEIGLRLASENPVSGLGPRSPQPGVLANSTSTTLYVHNEYLQQWLKFGLAGLLVVLVLFATLLQRGWSVLRAGPTSVLYAGAATISAIAWLPMLTAPFLTTTQRVPVLIGAAVALCEVVRAPRPVAGRHASLAGGSST